LLETPNIDTSAPTVIAANERQWFAVVVRPRSERSVASHFRAKRVEHFLPIITEKHRWSDRTKNVEVPLFSGYVFVNIVDEAERLLDILRVPGALHFVGLGRFATSIPGPEIQALQTLFQSKLPVAAHEFIQVGERVRVRGGCMDGIEGVLIDRRAGTLVLSLTTIQRSVAISIQGFAFERI
jgi:transcription termination/antitermination protein NusG